MQCLRKYQWQQIRYRARQYEMAGSYRKVHHVVCGIFPDPRFAQCRDFSKSAQEEGLLLQALRLYYLGRVARGNFCIIHTVASGKDKSKSPSLPAFTDASVEICTVIIMTQNTAGAKGAFCVAERTLLQDGFFRRGLP